MQRLLPSVADRRRWAEAKSAFDALASAGAFANALSTTNSFSQLRMIAPLPLASNPSALSDSCDLCGFRYSQTTASRFCWLLSRDILEPE
jgi:hypothetical protein